MIELAHVSYAYPGAAQPTLVDLSLTIAAGEFIVVYGPSGAGKSTFLRLLNGLVPHFYGGTFGGDVRLWGRSTRDHQPRDLADVVGFVFQNPEAQFVVDVVEDELVFGMENLGLAPRLMRRRVEEVLDQLGIADLRRRRVSTLSGGEQQRVAIAAVLAAQPRALVLDEPTSQLDPHAAEEVLTALQKLNDDLGLTIVLCEHRLERVAQYADRMLYFPAGNQSADMPQYGPPRAVLAQTALAPPLVQLGKQLGWQPLPLTIKEGRRLVATEPTRWPTHSQALPATSHQPPATSHQPPAIELRGLHVGYGAHEALYDLSLTAAQGEVLALMGRNGSGKTTLLKLLIGLVRPQRGHVRVLGHDVTQMDVADIGAFVGYVPQDPRTLLFHDTLREELAFTLRNRGAQTQSSKLKIQNSKFGNGDSDAIAETLALLGLAQHAERYPRDLSGGEAQRAALAAVLVGEPPLLLLDEPTRGLDYGAKERLAHVLRKLAAGGRTIVIATHDVEMVAGCADRVALLGDGELVVEGPVREILSDSLIFSPQIAKLFPHSGWLTVADVRRGQ